MPISNSLPAMGTLHAQATPAMVAAIRVQQVSHRGEQVALIDRPVEHSVKTHGIQTAQFIFILDAGDSDVPAGRGVLSLACLEEGLLLQPIPGEDHEVKALTPQRSSGCHAIADHLELMIGPLGAQNA